MEKHEELITSSPDTEDASSAATQDARTDELSDDTGSQSAQPSEEPNRDSDIPDDVASHTPTSRDLAPSDEAPREDSPTSHRSRFTHPIYFADRIAERTRRRSDLVELITCALGVALVWAIGFFASSTTQGVAQDVLRFAVIREILLLPVTFIEGMAILVTPIAVIAIVLLRRQMGTVIEALTTAALAAIGGLAFLTVLNHLPESVTAPLRVTPPTGDGTSVIAINLVAITLVALFTAAGEAEAVRTIRYSWWSLAVIMVLWVLRGQLTLPSALISLLIGRMFGAGSRWVLGFQDRSASGTSIVRALLSIGIVPSRVIRTDVRTQGSPLTTWFIDEGEDSHLHMTPAHTDATDFTVTRIPPEDGHRHYHVWDASGTTYEITLLDPGRGFTGTLMEVWNNIRLRGISRWIAPSLKAAAERSTLTALSALRAGVHVPEPLGIAQAGDSVLMASRALPPTSTLRDLESAESLSDDLLDEAWHQLVVAHSHMLAHRELTFSSVVLDESSKVWLVDWDHGEVATTELNQRIDIAQMLTLLALVVGPKRALTSARRHIDEATLVAAAPVLQRAVLPTEVALELRRSSLLDNLRAAIVSVSDTPDESIELANLQRFAPKTVIMLGVAAVAGVLLLGSLNFSDITAAVQQANPVWILVAFLLAALTWVGGAVPLVAFSQEKIRFIDALLAQVAASIVTLVAPAGIGPAALNLRFLNKQKMSTPAAVTTVTLQQISQFLVTVTLLIIVVFFSGSSISVALPYGAILAGVVVVAALVTVCVSVPKLRRFIWSKVEPTWKQVYPRLLWVAGQPQRLLAVLVGNILMNVGFIGAFWASLAAMGGSLNITTLSITYLASNSLGSVVPSPGGIGPVEAALTGGLQVAGIALSVALPTAVIYRLVTFYGRAPFGWVALKIMQKRHLI